MNLLNPALPNVKGINNVIAGAGPDSQLLKSSYAKELKGLFEVRNLASVDTLLKDLCRFIKSKGF